MSDLTASEVSIERLRSEIAQLEARYDDILPFADAGIGNKMRQWCDEAGLPECSAHGLKKIAAKICAELGATDRMLMALFDWKSEKLANVYTAKANKKKLAADAAKLLGNFSWPRLEEKRSGQA